MANSKFHTEARLRRRGSRLLAILLVPSAVVVSACGSHESRVSANPADMAQSVAIRYNPPHPGKVRRVPVDLGRVLFLRVSSPVAAEVEIETYGVSSRVAANRTATLVLSADHPGTFDVRVVGSDRPIAQLVIAKD